MTKILTQLAVHVENRPGAVADLAETLEAAGVNIKAIAVPHSWEYGTVRILPDDLVKAREALDSAGLAYAAAKVLEVVLPDRPGALALLTRALADEQMMVRYAYCTILEGSERASFVLQVDDLPRAQEVLNRALQ